MEFVLCPKGDCPDMIHKELAKEMEGKFDLLLIASAWPDVRTGNIPSHGVKKRLSKPSFERPEVLANQLAVPVVYCNLGGEFTTKVPGLGITYRAGLAGHSCIIDPRAQLFERARSTETSLIVAKVSLPGVPVKQAVT